MHFKSPERSINSSAPRCSGAHFPRLLNYLVTDIASKVACQNSRLFPTSQASHCSTDSRSITLVSRKVESIPKFPRRLEIRPTAIADIPRGRGELSRAPKVFGKFRGSTRLVAKLLIISQFCGVGVVILLWSLHLTTAPPPLAHGCRKVMEWPGPVIYLLSVCVPRATAVCKVN